MKVPTLSLFGNGMKSRTFVLLVAVLLGVFALSVALVSAHGTVDQSNDPETSTSIGCGTPPIGTGSLYQSFTVGGSSNTSLVAVDLRLRTGGTFPAEGYSTTARLRQSVGGAILAEATAFVGGPQSSGNKLLVHFDFTTPTVVHPGDVLVIEWVSPGDGILTWLVRMDNPYPGGNAFGCGGDAAESYDFNFVTYVETLGADDPGDTDPGDAGPGGPSQAGEHANSRACEDNPGRANEHRPADIPPCRR